DDADGRAAAFPLVDRQDAVQRSRPLLELVEATSTTLAGRIVGDRRLDAAVLRPPRRDPQPSRGAATDGLVERLANVLVHGRLRLPREQIRRVHVELDTDAVRQRDLIRQSSYRRRETLIAQHDGFEIEREVAQLADRRAMTHERAADDFLRLLTATLADRVQSGIEQQSDSGQG